MTIDQQGQQFRLHTGHSVLWSLAISLAGSFVGAYFLHLGFEFATTLLLFALLLAIRFGMRVIILPLIRNLGLRRAALLGTVISSLQFLPLIRAQEPLWVCIWIAIVSTGEAIYWPIYHAASAVCGADGYRGRQVAARQVARAAVSVVGPVVGGVLLTRLGAGAEFTIATLLCLMSMAPLLCMKPLDLGTVPTVWRSLKVTDVVGFCAFAADGWMSAGLAMAWPMILYSTLGSSYDALGWAVGTAAMTGAVAGLGCGLAIDRGHRAIMSRGIMAALLIGIALRAVSSWAPGAAFAANMTGAAIGGLYYPVLMSVVYDRAKRSSSAYQFHLATEAGWDTGAILGCLATAAVAWTSVPVSLAVLPSALGVLVIHHCVRAESNALSTAAAKARATKGVAVAA